MRSCICQTEWCSAARTKHLFGNRVVLLTSNIREREIWIDHLEITGDDILHVETLADPRVWVGHFHYKDFIVSSDDEGFAVFDRIEFKSVTKYRESDTGNSSLLSSPRPAATKNLVIQSFLGDCRKLTYADYSLLNNSIESRRRRKRTAVENNVFTTPPPTVPQGRGFSVPFFEFFIGMSENLISLMRSMNLHGRLYDGSIHFRRAEVTTKRLALTVRCTCSLGKGCKSWATGVFRWQSTSDIAITPSRSVPIPDILYALAVCMTPNTMAHADQLFSSMMLTPPSRNLLKDIIKLVIDPYLIEEKNRLITEACGSIRDAGLSPILCMDVGHSSARNSQAATLAAASGNILLFTMTDTVTNAWLKETALVERALKFAINEEKLDVCMVEIDDNAKNASIITSFTRVNGPTETSNEPVRAGIDVFHAAKAMGKHIIKAAAENSSILEKFFKPLCSRNLDVADINNRINEMMLSKSNDFFSDIKGVFANFGADAWKTVSETPASMRDFAETNNLVDIPQSYLIWEPVVSAWNLSFPGKQALTSIAKIKITTTLSTKTLRNISLATMKVTGIPIPDVDKSNEKMTLFMYMKKNLPDICYRGNNISIDLADITQEIQKDIKDLPATEAVSLEDPDEAMMMKVFGLHNRSLQEIRKLKTDKITTLAKHLAAKADTDAPIKASEMKTFCIRNFWRMNSLWDDIHEAMGIAQRAFIARLGEFKRTLKSLLRVVNEIFGDWSVKFKMCFLINGLLNFVKHYSENHDDCARYFWWTQCSDTVTKYEPTQEYITDITSGRGIACRNLIPAFFKILVTAFVISKYAESQFWKCLSFSKTTICESYFHWKSIMIPKWQNIPAREYERKERAAFIAFVKRQKGKVFLMKKLVTNKYANTLTIASSHKNSRYESHILDAVGQICNSSSAVLAAVDHFAKKCDSRKERRHKLFLEVTTRYEGDETAMNLSLGPVKHELRTLDNSGGPASNFSELTHSARPVAPFPFKNEKLLDDDSKHRIEKVWMSSRAVKKSRLEKHNDQEEGNVNLCYCCDLEIGQEKIECFVCNLCVHSDCLEVYKPEWQIDNEGFATCKLCSSFDRLAQRK